MSGQTEITLTSYASEPSTAGLYSDDSEVRKSVRRFRLKNRLDTIARNEYYKIHPPIERKEGKGPVGEQRYKSNVILDKAVKDAIYHLNNCSVLNNVKNIKDANKSASSRKVLMKALTEENKAAQEVFNSIVSKWCALQNVKEPIHMKERVLKVKIACEQALEGRNAILETIKKAIIEADKDFNKSHKKNDEDVENLSLLIDKHIAIMKSVFGNQLENVKKTIETVKNDYLNNKYRKWFDLHEQVHNGTQKLFNDGYLFVNKIESGVKNLQRDNEDKYRKKKTDLYTDVQLSQQEQSNIKSVLVRNIEIYEYNIQILSLRAEDNTLFRSYQGRKINKLREEYYHTKNIFSKFKNETNKYFDKITADINKLKNRIVSVDTKSDNFAELNDKIFKDMFKLNNEKCQAVIDRILMIDKILHEQQLGNHWVPPIKIVLDIKELGSYKRIERFMTMAQTRTATQMDAAGNKRKDVISKNLEMCVPSDEEKWKLNYQKLLANILFKLSDKTGFLTEKLIKQTLKNHDEGDKFLVKMESVFNSLKVVKENDIDTLLFFFLPYAYCRTCMDAVDQASTDTSVLSQMSQHMSDKSFMSTFNLGSNRGDKSELLKMAEAIRFTTHSRESVENAILDIILTNIDQSKFYVDSEYMLDIAAADNAEIERTERESSSSKKKQIQAQITRDKMMCQFNHKLVISHIYVIRGLMDFIIYYYKLQQKIIPTVGQRTRKKRYTLSRLMPISDIVKYWKRVEKKFGEDSPFYTLWRHFSRGLDYYLQVLKERKLAIKEVENLRKENAGLRRMIELNENHRSLLPPICEMHCQCTTISKPKILRKDKMIVF